MLFLKVLQQMAVVVAWGILGDAQDAGPSCATGRLVGIPTAPYSCSSSAPGFSVSAIESVVVDSRYLQAVDDRGQTLIPPTLGQFAATFAGDLLSVLNLKVSISVGSQCPPNGVFLTLGDPADYRDKAGRPTSEGYTLTVNSTGIIIAGASPLGAWWGTRTVLQQGVLLQNGASSSLPPAPPSATIPYGSGLDTPGWGTRGMMLDIGRHFYPKDFLIEMCAYMSYFKQNTFHLHLSDNLFNNPKYSRQEYLDLYARFRLFSDSKAVEGLNRFRNESYTRQEFDEIQTACATRGVTILPELEAPGHSLVTVQWKPQLAYGADLSLLNISHPDTIPSMTAVWSTFLGWFHVKTVSIGADEYRGPVADYTRFVNAMNGFIGQASGKSMRIWGTFPPVPGGPGQNVHQNVSIQHWAYFEDDPYVDFIQHNYSVVNSNDDFYVVNKYGGYPSTIKMEKIFHGSPDRGAWYPNIFHQTIASRNPPASHPLVLGSIVPLWNDYGANATVYSEAYYAWRRPLPALADKQWGGSLTQAEFDTIFDTLQVSAPAQNLDRAIPSRSPTIFSYSSSSAVARTRFRGVTLLVSNSVNFALPDSSGNGYHANTDCPVTENGTLALSPACSIITPLSSKGRNYTLSMSIMLTGLERPSGATLLSGGDSSLMLTPALTLFASGNYYSLNPASFSLPLNVWVDITISGEGTKTFATVAQTAAAAGSGVLPSTATARAEFQTKMGINGDTVHWDEMAIEAPLRQVAGPGCGWTGQLRSLSLTSTAAQA